MWLMLPFEDSWYVHWQMNIFHGSSRKIKWRWMIKCCFCQSLDKGLSSWLRQFDLQRWRLQKADRPFIFVSYLCCLPRWPLDKWWTFLRVCRLDLHASCKALKPTPTQLQETDCNIACPSLKVAICHLALRLLLAKDNSEGTKNQSGWQ